MTMSNWIALGAELEEILRLTTPPVAISFSEQRPDQVLAFDDPVPPPMPDGRTGRVPAGCVFWVKATERTFSTVPEDHGNCSVGRLTHGMATLDGISGNSDVAELLNSGWVGMDDVVMIPTISTRPGAVTYGPLREATLPDVVLLRVNGRQLMVLSDALPGLRIEGKPQCHVIAIAKEQGEVAASVGCALSRARTGMRVEEMICAIPAGQLGAVVDKLRRTAAIDAGVARYAAEDARRFA
ncbi:DUF169 domain-containing protein [Mycobacterium spongiae]|uniref:Uncharacterized protein n=1 Tax=Mycobacterium spongiae TaxID=886343 RepID=A0A975K1I7_9MYCO|nr:DUF169 domain-containing protein [Mycobacterium spongiae]QUR68974.1 hypothetical protein F6B93_19560 [Mycobacterium spongiae]